MAKLFATSGDLDQTPQNVACELGLHCLPITIFGVFRLKWIEPEFIMNVLNRHHVTFCAILVLLCPVRGPVLCSLDRACVVRMLTIENNQQSIQ